MDARISVNSGRYRRLSPPGAAALSIWELAAPRDELARALGLASLPEVDRPRRIVAGGRDPFDEGVLWLRAVVERECRAELHLHGGAGVAGSLRAVLDEFGWSETAVPLDPDRQRFLRARAPLAARAAADAFASGLTARIAAAGAGTVAERESLAHELLAEEAWARLLEEPPLLALAGPPNAGKSTLFNALTKARSYAADQLFATLDTTTRQLWLPNGTGTGCAATLSDTVGFIRDLPHRLVEAFQATLQEAAEADLLLHVVDAASPALEEQMAEVERVLEEIGAADVPQLLVFNKCDRLEASRQPREAEDWVELPGGVRRRRVFVSAITGAGLDVLRKALSAEVLAREPYSAASESTAGTTDMTMTTQADDGADAHPAQHHA